MCLEWSQHLSRPASDGWGHPPEASPNTGALAQPGRRKRRRSGNTTSRVTIIRTQKHTSVPETGHLFGPRQESCRYFAPSRAHPARPGGHANLSEIDPNLSKIDAELLRIDAELSKVDENSPKIEPQPSKIEAQSSKIGPRPSKIDAHLPCAGADSPAIDAEPPAIDAGCQWVCPCQPDGPKTLASEDAVPPPASIVSCL